MNKIKVVSWSVALVSAIAVAVVAFAQDAGVEELVKEMKAPATTVAVGEPVAMAPDTPAEPVVEKKEEAPAPAAEAPAAEEKPKEIAPAAPAEPAVEKKETVPAIEELAPAAEKKPEATAPEGEKKESTPAIEELAPAEKPQKEPAPAAEAAPAAEPAKAAVPEVAEGAPEAAPAVAPTGDRSELAESLAKQEEVRRQARELEGRKSMEDADKAWKADDYEKALLHYRNAASKLPRKPAVMALREKAAARIPECQYHIVLDIMRDGRPADAVARGKEMLGQNADNPPLKKLVTRIEKDLDSRKGKKGEETGTAAEKIKAEVPGQMYSGKKFMAERNYEKARESFESVLAVEPENREAMRYLKELGDREYISKTTERRATAAKMTAQVREAWNPQYKVIKAREEKQEKPVQKTVPLLDKMAKIIIPEIEFRQANIHDVVEFLNKAAVDADRETVDQTKRGVNIILNLNPTGAAAPAAAPAPAGGTEDLFGTPAAKGGGGGSQPNEITFTARYISLLQALKIITNVAGLKYRIDGDIVMIVPTDFDPAEIEVRMYPVEPTFIERVREAGQQMPAATEQIGGKDMQRLHETDIGGTVPTDLKSYFTGMGVKFPSGSSITYNSAIGKVIVGNTSENLAVFEKLLSELNVVPKQVEIEARFVEVNETDLMEVGLEWLLTDNWELATKGGGTLLGGQQRIRMNANAANGGFTRGLRFWGTGGDGADTPMADGQGIGGRVASISSVLTNPELTMILHLLQQNGNADLLSAPKVTTRSGNEATIKVVTEYIYPTSFEVNGGQIGFNNNNGGGNNANIVQETTVMPQDFATREVGVLLTVMPEVSPDGNMINLTMQPQVVTEPTWYQYGSKVRRADGSEATLNMPQPFFHVRSVNTQISIYDGATVVMGGLITEDLRKVNDKIPVLGDIPLLGAFFRSKSERSVKKNLLIFVTAKLVDPAGRVIRQAESASGSLPASLIGSPAKPASP